MYDEYIPEVVQAVPGDDYSIFVYFSDGKTVRWNMSAQTSSVLYGKYKIRSFHLTR